MTCEFFFKTCNTKEIVKLSKCKVSELKSSFVISSKKPVNFEKIKFDDCSCKISKANEKRCDWVINSISNNTLYFIELKGCDIVKALVQLENTVKIIQPKIKFECHIVKSGGSGGLPSFSTKFQIVKRKMLNKGGDIFRPHTNTHTINI